MLTITGYSDRISVRPGETIKFMVNCEHPTYQADIVRLICADATPSGPGFKEKLGPHAREQAAQGTPAGDPRGLLRAGGEPAAAGAARQLHRPGDDLADHARQGRAGDRDQVGSARRTGFALMIDDAGSVALRLGMADGTVETVSVGKPLLERHWYLAAASYDAGTGRVTVHQEPLLPYARVNDGGTAKRTLGRPPPTRARPSSWPASSSGGRRGARWSTASITARSIRPGWSAGRWTGWRSSACGTRRCRPPSRQTSSAPGTSRATSRPSGFPTAPPITSTARSSTCRPAA